MSDGDELHLYQTNPCRLDTDGDRLPDGIDPFPTNSKGNMEYIAGILRDLAVFVSKVDQSRFTAPNASANKALREVLVTHIEHAARRAVSGDPRHTYRDVLDAYKFVDDEKAPPDFMRSSIEKQFVAMKIDFVLSFLTYLIPQPTS